MASVNFQRRGYAKPWRLRHEDGVGIFQRSFATKDEALTFASANGIHVGGRGPAIDRVLAKVRISDSGCWVFNGTRGARGYGTVTHQGRTTGSHRVSYEHFIGTIPAGMQIDHLCRNTSCCNPDHLEAVTQAENLRREHLLRAAAREAGAL